MIKNNQQHFNRLHVVLDAIVVMLSYVIAWWIKFSSGIVNPEIGVLSFNFYMKALILIVPLYLLLYYAFNLYTPKRVQGRRLELSNIIMANTIGILIVFAGFFLVLSYSEDAKNFSRSMFVYFYIINIILEEIERLFIRAILRSVRKKGYNLKHILLVGYSKAAEQYIDRIKQNPQWGYDVQGILDDNIARGTVF